MEIERRIRLSAIHVEWSPTAGQFVAQSAQYPDLTYRDDGSSLGAVDGLMDAIRRSLLASARDLSSPRDGAATTT